MHQAAISTVLRRAAAAMALAWVLTGCSSAPPTSPPDQALDRARAELAVAEQDPDLNRYAPEQLQAARAALLQAEQGDDTPAQQAHLAYLVGRHLDIARAQTRRKIADQQIQALLQNGDGARPTEPAGEALRAHERAQSARDTALAAQLAREPPGADQRQLEAELAALEVQTTETDRGLVLTLSDAVFVPERSEAKGELQTILQPLVAYLRTHPDRHVLVEGHTDSNTPLIESLRLSQGRADAVRDQLVAEGIAGARIDAQGFGPDEPIADNDTPAGRERNRRVEVIVTARP